MRYIEMNARMAKAVGYMKPTIDPQLRLYVPFNEGVGSVAKDYSQYGNHAVLTDVEWGIGMNGNAGRFNGVSLYVNCGNDASLNITDAITIEAWVKRINNDTTLIFKGGGILGSGTASGYIIYISSTNLIGVNFRHGSTETFISSSFAIPTEWTHFVVTNNNGDIKTYINGIADNTGTSASPWGGNTVNLSIGHKAWRPNYFNGTIDEVRIYNQALAESAAQIAADCYEVVCN